MLRLQSRKVLEQTWLYAGNSENPCVPRSRGKNRRVRTIRREGRSNKPEPSETARQAPASRWMMIQSTPHGDMGRIVNKVSVGEPADGSPPKELRGDSAELREAEHMKQVCLWRAATPQDASSVHRFFLLAERRERSLCRSESSFIHLRSGALSVFQCSGWRESGLPSGCDARRHRSPSDLTDFPARGSLCSFPSRSHHRAGSEGLDIPGWEIAACLRRRVLPVSPQWCQAGTAAGLARLRSRIFRCGGRSSPIRYWRTLPLLRTEKSKGPGSPSRHPLQDRNHVRKNPQPEP